MLEPPWPDLVISSGVRNEPVCRWIRAQSGGRTRYVHVGRPWGPLASFDLVITTPQYRVPAHPNVLNNMLTLHSVTPQRLASARDQWAAAFAHLPRPRIAVIVGGDSGPFTLGPKAASRLARQASTLARQSGGLAAGLHQFAHQRAGRLTRCRPASMCRIISIAGNRTIRPIPTWASWPWLTGW